MGTIGARFKPIFNIPDQMGVPAGRSKARALVVKIGQAGLHVSEASLAAVVYRMKVFRQSWKTAQADLAEAAIACG